MSFTVHRCTSAKLREFFEPQRFNNAFEFDSNPSEDRQQIHWRSSEAGVNLLAVFRRPLIKRVVLCALRKTANKFIRNFVYTNLSTTGPIRGALTSQDLSSDTKFSPSQSHETLPLKGLCHKISNG